MWCLIAEWSARTTCRIFGSVEPIIWWALHGANSPSSSASCLRATGVARFRGSVTLDQVPAGVVDVLGHPAKTIPKACLIELVVGHRWRQGKSFSRAC